MKKKRSFITFLTTALLATQAVYSLTVTTLDNSGEGSLRWAVATVATNDEITFSPSLHDGMSNMISISTIKMRTSCFSN